MKKPPSMYQRLRWQENAEKRAKHIRRRDSKRRSRRQRYDWQTSKTGKIYKHRVQLQLPEDFSLSGNYDKIVEIVNRLKSPGYRYINFHAVRRVSAAAALMLAAEMEVGMIQRKNFRLVAHNGAWTPQVRKSLKQMGFLDLLNASPDVRQTSDTSEPEEVFVKFKSHHELTADAIGEIIREVGEFISAGKIAPELRLPLYAGMSEAITNTYQHAYKEKHELNRWWISASVAPGDGKITVVCYDRGQTIPGTIWESEPKREQFKKWAMGNHGDHRIILHAMKEGQSSTRKKHRGRGLRELMHLIERNGQGDLKIYSGDGMARYVLGEKGGDPYFCSSLPCTMAGTLIEWSIIPSSTKGGKL